MTKTNLENEITIVNVSIIKKKLNQSFTYMIDSVLYNQINYGDLVLIEFNNEYVIGMVENKNKIPSNQINYQLKKIEKILKYNEFEKNYEELSNYITEKLYSEKKDINDLILKKNIIEKYKLVINLKINNKNITKEFLNKYQKEIKNEQIAYNKIKKEDRLEIKKYFDKQAIDLNLDKLNTVKIKVYKVEEINIQKELEEIKENKINSKEKFEIEILEKMQKDLGYYTKKEYLEMYNISEYKFNKYRKKKLIIEELIDENTKIENGKHSNLKIQKKIELTQEQEEVIEQINKTSKPVLLHGITGSGKTAVFIKLIEEQMKLKKQTLLLVPEKILTVQMIKKLEDYFPGECGYFHNSITENENHKLLEGIKSGNIKLIIGTRSTIFLKIPKLGLVIVDEEHDNSYKQNKYPYYHIDNLYDYYLKKGIKIILSSATPRLITYAKAQKNIYQLIELNKRYNDYQLPDITFKEYDQNEIINRELINRIKTEFAKKKNVLVLFNVKGYSRSVECRTCGAVAECPNCKIPLKYYKDSNALECGYCGYSIPFNNQCPTCKHKNMKLIGLGIEKVTEEFQKYLNPENILRIDGKVAKTKNKLNNIIEEFQNGENKILIGTQIIAKGLNFNNVDLVIVLNSDNMLFFNDFTTNEQTYQLLEQVSGRSGRNSYQSEVIIYTNHQENFVYQAVQKHNYKEFFKEEMLNRKLQKSVPYYYLCMIELRSKNLDKLRDVADFMHGELEGKGLLVTKIVEPYINKIEEKYRRKIFIKYKNENIKEIIKEIEPLIKENKIELSVDLEINSYGY